MSLSPEQKTTLKATIIATPSLNAFYAVGDLGGLADALNAAATPAFTVWKTSVTLVAIGKAMDGAEAASLVTANNTRLQVRAAFMAGGENPSVAGTRAFYDDIFSTGGVTKAALAILWKRGASVIEKIFATGPGSGSDASPATLTYEGTLPYTDLIGL
jgi:hypothetical protein